MFVSFLPGSLFLRICCHVCEAGDLLACVVSVVDIYFLFFFFFSLSFPCLDRMDSLLGGSVHHRQCLFFSSISTTDSNFSLGYFIPFDSYNCSRKQNVASPLLIADGL